MIQELLGGSGATGGLIGSGEDIKVSPLSGGILQPSPSPSPSPSSSTNTTATPPQNSSENQNQLRCPRCDSSNTKFCYYNNYNLTQPRHFCKTCRRYWTKGGALRNVPIGGGCRKNSKGNVGLVPSLGKPNISTGKLMKTHVFSSPEIGKSNSGFLSGFDHHDLSSNPILWASPQTSHLLALLRSTPNPNPNPMLNPFSTKEEGFLIGSHNSEPGYAHGFLNARPGSLGLDPISSSFWRNDNQNQVDQQQQQNGNFILGEVQNTGIQDQLYQRLSLKSSTNYYSDHPPAVLVGNVLASSSNSSANLESAPVSGGEIGNFWNNPSLSWSDLSTTNGAYR